MRCQPALRLFSLRFVDTSFAPVRASLQILFLAYQSFFNEQFRQRVALGERGDEQFLHRYGRLFVQFDHCASSFDHFVRPCQHVWRNCQAYLLGSFQIDDELKLCRLLYGRVSGCQS